MALTNINNKASEMGPLDIGDSTIKGKFPEPISLSEYEGAEYWFDRAVEYPGRYRETPDPDDPSKVYHEPDEGVEVVEGTPLSARNLNIDRKAIYWLLKFYQDLRSEITKLRTDINTQLGLNETGSFIMSIQDGDFEVIDGWYNEAEQRVEVV